MRAAPPKSDAPYLPQENVNGDTVPKFVTKWQIGQEPAAHFRRLRGGLRDLADSQTLSIESHSDAEISDRVVQTRTEAAATRLALPYMVAKR